MRGEYRFAALMVAAAALVSSPGCEQEQRSRRADELALPAAAGFESPRILPANRPVDATDFNIRPR